MKIKCAHPHINAHTYIPLLQVTNLKKKISSTLPQALLPAPDYLLGGNIFFTANTGLVNRESEQKFLSNGNIVHIDLCYMDLFAHEIRRKYMEVRNEWVRKKLVRIEIYDLRRANQTHIK